MAAVAMTTGFTPTDGVPTSVNGVIAENEPANDHDVGSDISEEDSVVDADGAEEESSGEDSFWNEDDESGDEAPHPTGLHGLLASLLGHSSPTHSLSRALSNARAHTLNHSLSHSFSQTSSSSATPQPGHYAICDTLRRCATGYSPEVFDAFRAVDRARFLPEECRAHAYVDAPIRRGVAHHSAPSIYATALDSLELKPGNSFLNIGSGSGYFSALVAQLIGRYAVHVGVEIYSELVELARERCAELGLDSIKFVNGNAFDLALDGTMRFDRIYIGAGAGNDARFLFKLLKPGGIIVGPFEMGNHGNQMLRQVTRSRGECGFSISNVLAVTFRNLERPKPGPPFVLAGPVWGVDRCSLFKPSFLSVAALLRWSCMCPGTLAYKLPWDIWQEYILPLLPYDAFEHELPSLCVQCDGAPVSFACDKCKTPLYCGKRCKKAHALAHSECCSAAA